MAADRDAARIEIARRGLAPNAVELVARTSFGRMPITLVDRARALVRQFFSESPWTVEDDSALAGLVGPGAGFSVEELAPGLRVAFGWKAGAFKVDAVCDAGAVAAAEPEPNPDEPAIALPVHERTLGDTFEDTMVIEAGRDPETLRFSTGPGSTRSLGRFTREEQGELAGVAALFREFEGIEEIRLDNAYVTITITDSALWSELLLEVFDAVIENFIPRVVPTPDRQYERAVAELGPLDATSSRDLARLLDAVTSPNASFRQLAVAKLEDADPLVVQKPWGHALGDSSRAVRRAAIRAAAHNARPESRLLFERALVDKDACVRYYAVRGLAQVGVGRAADSVEKRRRDDDLRVRMAAIAALEGKTPR
jgi:hypothetical protein